MQLDSSFPLKPTQFLDPSGNIFDKYIHVPLLLPTECSKCRPESSLKCQAGSKSIAVTTRYGRFDLSHTSFCCSKCLCIAEARVEVYLQSGFWPGCPKALTYLFSSDILEHWTHLKHHLLESSERKYLTILEELPKTRGRFDVISRVHFAPDSREYEYMQHQINTKIFSRQVMVCKACGVKPKALHVDEAISMAFISHQISLSNGDIVHSDEDVKSHGKGKILVDIAHIPLAVKNPIGRKTLTKWEFYKDLHSNQLDCNERFIIVSHATTGIFIAFVIFIDSTNARHF